MKKTFDAVFVMREARKKLAEDWENKPREEEINSLRRKYASLKRKKKSAPG
ncbi:MAG: hypothetical protein Q7N50_13745 [Armatimonadota bacterium]|nr:hypothetical protein [Armatimonadota bacterium]